MGDSCEPGERRHLTEVARDLSVSALRGAQLSISLEDVDDEKVFPVFQRKGDVQDTDDSRRKQNKVARPIERHGAT